MSNICEAITMEVKASLRQYRQSPRKVRLVADLIRGKSVVEAMNQLNFSVKRASQAVRKLLLSAVANAEHNHKLSEKTLYVKGIQVDQGVIMKRGRPRMGGRMFPIHKHTSHVNLVLAEREPKKTPSTKSEALNKSKKAKAIKKEA